MGGDGRIEATLLANVSVGLLPLRGSNVIFSRLQVEDLFGRGLKLLQLEALASSMKTLFSLPGAHVGANEINFDLKIEGFLKKFIARARVRVKIDLGCSNG